MFTELLCTQTVGFGELCLLQIHLLQMSVRIEKRFRSHLGLDTVACSGVRSSVAGEKKTANVVSSQIWRHSHFRVFYCLRC